MFVRIIHACIPNIRGKIQGRIQNNLLYKKKIRPSCLRTHRINILCSCTCTAFLYSVCTQWVPYIATIHTCVCSSTEWVRYLRTYVRMIRVYKKYSSSINSIIIIKKRSKIISSSAALLEPVNESNVQQE